MTRSLKRLARLFSNPSESTFQATQHQEQISCSQEHTQSTTVTMTSDSDSLSSAFSSISRNSIPSRSSSTSGSTSRRTQNAFLVTVAASVLLLTVIQVMLLMSQTSYVETPAYMEPDMKSWRLWSSCLFPSPATLPVQSSDANSVEPLSTTRRHVLFALSGNHSGFFGEFEVALKSVLLNGPVDDPLTVHILADQDAYNAIGDLVFDKAQLQTWTCRNPIRIITYNVQRLEQEWKALVLSRMARAADLTNASAFRHTVGAYYRLFSGRVLSNVDSVVYLDTDVVVLSSLDEIWNRYYNASALFQWGKGQCSGFTVLRPSATETIWELFGKVSTETFAEMLKPWPVVGDQFVLRAVNRVFPDRVGWLPPRWDVSAMNGPWKFKPKRLYPNRKEGVSMLHFNGGGESKEPYFKDHKHFQSSKHWGLAKYYVDLPWSWAQQTLKSRIRRENAGYPLELDYKVLS